MLSYRLPPSAGKTGPARVECEVETKPNIATALHKAYGQPDLLQGMLWTARSAIRNRGGSDVTDIRVRYRIAGRSPWSSDSRYDALPPGGTLVDCYYPVFDSRAMVLDRPAGAELEARISYRDRMEPPRGIVFPS